MNNTTSSDYDQTHIDATPVIVFVVGVFAIVVAACVGGHHRRRQRELSDSVNAGSVHVVIQRDAPAPASVFIFPFYKAAEAAAHSGCAVCIGDFEDGEVAEQLPGCGHVFHQRCIDPWLIIHPTCPICRNSTAAPPPPVARPAPLANH